MFCDTLLFKYVYFGIITLDEESLNDFFSWIEQEEKKKQNNEFVSIETCKNGSSNNLNRDNEDEMDLVSQLSDLGVDSDSSHNDGHDM